MSANWAPWLVTPDKVPNPQDLAVWLTVNDKSMQDGSPRTMVYQVPSLIHCLSQFMTLHPDAVISTGTPPGMGMKPQRFLKPGELGIDGLVQQHQDVIVD